MNKHSKPNYFLIVAATFAIAMMILMLASRAHAQNPGAFTTVVTTSTSTKSVCVGGNSTVSPSSCTGEMSSGTVTTTGAATFGGLVSSTGAGTHAFDAAANNVFRIRNTSAGPAQLSAFQVGNNTAAGLGNIYALSSTYTSAGALVADSMAIDSQGSGGLNLSASAGTVGFYTGGTRRWTIDASGHLVPATTSTFSIGSSSLLVDRLFMSAGSVSTPSIVWPGGGTDPVGLYADTSTNPGLFFSIDSAQFGFIRRTSNGRSMSFADYDQSGANGFNVIIGRNINGAGAAGGVFMGRLGGIFDCIWPDNTGLLRINTSCPNSSSGASDTAGTIVGTQTSTRASKNIHGRVTDTAFALEIIKHTPIYRFNYKSGAVNGEEFVGIVTEDSPEFGMDAGKSFNPVTAHGYTVLAIQELQKQIAALQAELAELKSASKRQ